MYLCTKIIEMNEILFKLRICTTTRDCSIYATTKLIVALLAALEAYTGECVADSEHESNCGN